jgi:hypothetical protein
MMDSWLGTQPSCSSVRIAPASGPGVYPPGPGACSAEEVVAMTAAIDQKLLEELRDRISHAVVFTRAAERAVKEAFELVQQIHEEEAENGG